jgi:hypothetical protein
MLTGFKTVFFNAFVVGLIAILTNLSSVDWTQYVSPTVAMLVMAVVNIALRLATSTTIFKGK